MKAYLLPSVYGFFAVDPQDEYIDNLFKTESLSSLSHLFLQLKKGVQLPEFEAFLKALHEKGYDLFEVEDPVLKDVIDQIEGMAGILVEDVGHFRALNYNLINYFIAAGIQFSAKKIPERTKILSEMMIKQQIAEGATQGDFLIKQAVDTLMDIDKSVNYFSARLREWYGLHFPELTDKLIDDNVKFAEFVARVGVRANFSAQELMSTMDLPAEKAEMIAGKAARSMGGKLSEYDFVTVQHLATQVISLAKYRQDVEQYLSDKLDETAPNLKAVIGPQITSKLISIAGSLERLAKCSSSTIQMLGAEKALFKAIKSGGKTPKYGILFQWNKIRAEKSYLRGKIARMVAGKISILAKVDYYRGEFIGDRLKEEIDRKIHLIQTQFPKPPVEKKRDTGDRKEYGKDAGRGNRGPPRGSKGNRGDFSERSSRSDRQFRSDRSDRTGQSSRPAYKGNRNDRPSYNKKGGHSRGNSRPPSGGERPKKREER